MNTFLETNHSSGQQQGTHQGCFTIQSLAERKRRRSKSSDCGRENGAALHDTASSMTRSIKSLKAQVSYLQLRLREFSVSPLSTSTGYRCPVKGCRAESSRVDYIHRHIRRFTDPDHEIVAAIIDETHCVDCSKSWDRPTDLVRHERYHHGGGYLSRLDNIAGIKQQSLRSPPRTPSPISGSTEAFNRLSGG